MRDVTRFRSSRSRKVRRFGDRGLFRWFWPGLIATWMVLISGVFRGGPGIIQFAQLKKILHSKEKELADLESQSLAVKAETLKIKQDMAFQEREIRKVLGYVASDEIIFDFTR